MDELAHICVFPPDQHARLLAANRLQALRPTKATHPNLHACMAAGGGLDPAFAKALKEHGLLEAVGNRMLQNPLSKATIEAYLDALCAWGQLLTGFSLDRGSTKGTARVGAADTMIRGKSTQRDTSEALTQAQKVFWWDHFWIDSGVGAQKRVARSHDALVGVGNSDTGARAAGWADAR